MLFFSFPNLRSLLSVSSYSVETWLDNAPSECIHSTFISSVYLSTCDLSPTPHIPFNFTAENILHRSYRTHLVLYLLAPWDMEISIPIAFPPFLLGNTEKLTWKPHMKNSHYHPLWCEEKNQNHSTYNGPKTHRSPLHACVHPSIYPRHHRHAVDTTSSSDFSFLFFLFFFSGVNFCSGAATFAVDERRDG